jgi:endoglucanase
MPGSSTAQPGPGGVAAPGNTGATPPGEGGPVPTGNVGQVPAAGTPPAGEASPPGAEGGPQLLPLTPPTPVRGQGEPVFGDARELTRLTYTFYGAQRSGAGPNWLLEPGEACHMNDGQSIGLDLSGGWYDAGDHLKVTLSIAYAAYVVAKGFDAYPAAFDDLSDPGYAGAANGVPDVLDEVRYATDYLVKAHIAADQLVAMIGDFNADHNQTPLRDGRCSGPAAASLARPISMDANADVAGITSAALALAARLYQPYEPALAATYLEHARQIYDIAKANPRGSNPGLYGQTREPLGWVDEPMCGATELYRATGEQTYLDDALALNDMLGSHQWAPNFSQAADFCRHSLIVGLREAGNLEAAQVVAGYLDADVQNYISKISTQPNTVGMMHMDEWGSLRYASGAGFGASLYYEVTGDATARDLALSQLNYIMGENTYNRSFVVGFGNNPPSNPHHRNQIATGKSLAGALVGGPTNGGGYTDSADDYVANEVAIDYNAGLVGLAAFGVVESGN